MADDLPAPVDPPTECCVFIPGSPNLFPGWGCGLCKVVDGAMTYNGLQRTTCKVCRHRRCSSGNGLRNLAGDEPVH